MTPDRLAEMLEMQRMLQKSLGYDFTQMSVEQCVAYAKEMSIHLTQEIHECLYELPFFKPWKDYSNMTDLDQIAAAGKAQAEMIDMWHFFMNMMLALGLTADKMYVAYKEKNQENYDRQVRGYTHDISYREANNG